MKKFTLMLSVFVIITTVISQTPQAFNYQAVVRNNSGVPIVNQVVDFKIGLLQGVPPGTLVYQEYHSYWTNNYGLAILEIGKGTPLYGDFSTIDWTAGQIFIHVELDPTGGGVFQDMGSSELLSVPYALYAGEAGGTGSNLWDSGGDDIFNTNSGNVGIGISSPISKMHIKGSENSTQLVVDANSSQSNSQPLIRLRNAAGTDLLWIHSDNINNTFVGLNAGRINNAAGGAHSNSFFGAGSGYSNTTGN